MRRTTTRALIVVGLALAALCFAFLRPPALGGSTEYVIVSGTSMEPTLYEDDLVVVRGRDRYGVGDVVAVRVPEGTPGPSEIVIHRIVAGNATDGYVTQGDNRGAHDEWRAAPDDILGARVVRIPKVGLVLGWLAEPLVIGFAIGAAVTSLLSSVRTRARGPAATAPRAEPVTPTVATPPSPAADLRPAHAAAPTGWAVTGGPHRHRRSAPTRDAVADRIRHRYERTTDPETRLRIRQTVFELAAAFASEDPDFDAAAFLRACGAHAYDVDATASQDHQR